VDDFWQQVAKFVFNFSNLLFSSIYATNRHWQAVVALKITTQVWIASARPIFDASPPFFGF